MTNFYKMKPTTWFIRKAKSRAVLSRDRGGGAGRREWGVIV